MSIQPVDKAPPTRAPSLASALIKARKSARATVYKAGHNQDQRYSYVGHEQVVVASRDALLDHGLSLEQRSVEYAGELVYQTRNGPKPVWRWIGQFALVHESGEERCYRYEATTQANDKAAFVASTALDRVAHMRVLELAGTADEDPEHDWHDERARQEDPRPAQPAPAGAARPQTPQDGPRQPDRTNDPPKSNLRRLPAPEETPEGQMARALFLPKLQLLRREADLRAWWAEVCKGDYPRNIKVSLYRMLEQHAKSCGHSAAAIVGGDH